MCCHGSSENQSNGRTEQAVNVGKPSALTASPVRDVCGIKVFHLQGGYLHTKSVLFILRYRLL